MTAAVGNSLSQKPSQHFFSSGVIVGATRNADRRQAIRNPLIAPWAVIIPIDMYESIWSAYKLTSSVAPLFAARICCHGSWTPALMVSVPPQTAEIESNASRRTLDDEQ